ncbi:hypothetical protein ACKUVQ_10825 [Mycobacterium seoulense]|uniref:hypothetical protein n=1 Tax=Mycobacterium seoulense TaxID=386911 RepID=UPI003CF95042
MIDFVHARDDMTIFLALRDDCLLISPAWYDGEEYFHDVPIEFSGEQLYEFILKLEKLRSKWDEKP